MKILLTVFFVRSLDIEGGDRTLHSMAKAYSKLGHAVTVLAPLTPKRGRPYKIIDYLGKTKPGLLNNARAYISALKKLAPSYDVVQIIELSPITSFFSRIVVEQNPNTYVMFGEPLLGFVNFVGHLNKMNVQYLKHFIIRNYFGARIWDYPCKKYIVSTQLQREQLQKIGIPKSKIAVIPYGVLGEEFKPYPQTRAKKEFGLSGKMAISYIGHFHHIKGVPVLLKAFESVLEKHPDSVLAIAWSGKGTESKQVVRMLRKEGLRENVKVFGVVDVRKFLAASDMVVLPYTYMSLPHFPLVMIEAFAMGTPVITTDVGGLAEMVKNKQTGIVVRPNNEKELAEAMGLLLQNKKLREKISKNERNVFKKKYGSDVAAKKYLKLFENG